MHVEEHLSKFHWDDPGPNVKMRIITGEVPDVYRKRACGESPKSYSPVGRREGKMAENGRR